MNTARINPGIPLLLNGVSKRYGDNVILNELDLHILAGNLSRWSAAAAAAKAPCCACWPGWKNPTAANYWQARRRLRRFRMKRV